VSFQCSHEQAEEILNSVKDDDVGIGSIDFNKLIPMPDDVYTGPLGMKEMAQYPGEKNWYDWSVNHWGTKWNAYGSDYLPKIDDSLVFQTAWSSVPYVIQELSARYPDVVMEYGWADEDFGSNTGKLEFKNGDVISVYIPDDQTPEAYEFAASVQGASLEDFGLTLDTRTGNIVTNDVMQPEIVAEHRSKDRGDVR
jgi:hypothetical protein